MQEHFVVGHTHIDRLWLSLFQLLQGFFQHRAETQGAYKQVHGAQRQSTQNCAVLQNQLRRAGNGAVATTGNDHVGAARFQGFLNVGENVTVGQCDSKGVECVGQRRLNQVPYSFCTPRANGA